MVKKVINVFVTILIVGILMALTGLLNSGKIESIDNYFKAVLYFAIVVGTAIGIKNLIGWIGIKTKTKFLPTLHYSTIGLIIETILFVLLSLILPFTGDIGA